MQLGLQSFSLRNFTPLEKYVAMLRELGADDVFHIYDEAGTAFADDAMAGAARVANALKSA